MNNYLDADLNEVAERAIEFARKENHDEARKHRKMFRKMVERIENNPALNSTIHLCAGIAVAVIVTLILIIAQL